MSDDGPSAAISVLLIIVSFTVLSLVITKCKSSCKKWTNAKPAATVQTGTVLQTIVATIPTRTTNNQTEPGFSGDNILIFGDPRNERSAGTVSGYDFSRRIEINIDPAPGYESPRDPEPVHFNMNSKTYLKPYDNDGLPTYEEVIDMNHQSRRC